MCGYGQLLHWLVLKLLQLYISLLLFQVFPIHFHKQLHNVSIVKYCSVCMMCITDVCQEQGQNIYITYKKVIVKYVNMAANYCKINSCRVHVQFVCKCQLKCYTDDHCRAKDQSAKPRNANDFKNIGIVHRFTPEMWTSMKWTGVSAHQVSGLYTMYSM